MTPGSLSYRMTLAVQAWDAYPWSAPIRESLARALKAHAEQHKVSAAGLRRALKACGKIQATKEAV